MPTKKTVPSKSRPDGALNEKQLLAVLTAFSQGDFSPRLPLDWTGVPGKIADMLNEILGRVKVIE